MVAKNNLKAKLIYSIAFVHSVNLKNHFKIYYFVNFFELYLFIGKEVSF